ncbi:MAG TPA: S-ribosylhomocysteine lyase, partial [Bacilli bacterium]
MEKIPSFTINHLNLLPGIYVSRYDYLNNEVLTTFDLRFVRPNIDQVLDTGTMHTIEHLGATFLRNYHNWNNKIIYFGPMGCRTGFYLIIYGKYEAFDILELIK